jgi:transketolase
MTTQRDRFFQTIGNAYNSGRNDLVILTADMGAKALNKFKKDPNFLINTGPCEQLVISMGAGLALQKKHPYCYGITPFISLRALEQIRIMCSMNLPVTIVGVGAGLSYDTAGLTHHATEDLNIIRCIPNITICNVSSLEMAEYYAKVSLDFDKPLYIRLDKYSTHLDNVTDYGWKIIKYPKKNYPFVVATGTIVDYLWRNLSYDYGFMEIFQFPIDERVVSCILKNFDVISVEEGYKVGGLGDSLSFLPDVKKIGFNNFCEAKPREEYWKILLREVLNA